MQPDRDDLHGPHRPVRVADAAYSCVTVTVSFDYQHNKIYGDIPVVSAFYPKTISATSVARINS